MASKLRSMSLATLAAEAIPVDNKKRDLVHLHEAMDQSIQEHLVSADDDVDISQGIVPQALLAPPIDPIVTR